MLSLDQDHMLLAGYLPGYVNKPSPHYVDMDNGSGIKPKRHLPHLTDLKPGGVDQDMPDIRDPIEDPQPSE